MADIKFPEHYVAKAGIIGKAGEHIKAYGSKALIIGSKTALKAVADDLTRSLTENGITYLIEEFSGYPTLEKAKKYAEKAKGNDCNVLVAVGGGKVIDVTKAAGSFSKLSVVTIPTIAATCAAWAAVSVIYTDEGDFEQFYQNKYTPKLILIDYQVLAAAPERYIKAGIVDTYAKWYELTPGVNGKSDDLTLQLSYFGAKLAYEILDDHIEGALKAAKVGEVNEDIKQVIDAIIFLAGYAGSFVGARVYSGYAHPFYHCSRRIESSRKALHGELVAYGILTQLILEKKTECYINETIDKFAAFDEAFTLEELGLAENAHEDLAVIAQRTLDEFGSFTKLGIGQTVEELVTALLKADEMVKRREVV